MPGPTPSVANKFLRDLIKKFPDAGALTIAKAAYRKSPEMWRDVEACRGMVRKILGVAGKDSRKDCNKSQYREPRKAGWVAEIPSALADEPAWGPVQYDGPLKVLVLNDIHIPFHDPEALAIAIESGVERGVNMVLLNGDIMDHYALSKFIKDPKRRDFPAEIRAGKKFLSGLRKTFPKAQLVYRWGNHEERFNVYMRIKCMDFCGVEEFEWGNIFGLHELKIDLVKTQCSIRLGKLNTLHGHEYPHGISSPVNAARGIFMRAKGHVLIGHHHQSHTHQEQTIDQHEIATFSVGCLCDKHPEYARFNNWGHGFAFVTVDKDGAFSVENKKIIKGKVW